MTAGTGSVQEWSERAACAGHDLDVFFASSPDRAKAICRRCPVRAECLYDALTHDTPSGVWGGLTISERRAIPLLPHTQAMAIAALREVLDEYDTAAGDDSPAPERTARTMSSTNTRPGSPVATPGEQLSISKLLSWASEHPDPEVQDQGARAEAALTGLRTRYAADAELASISTEAAQLEKRLAELRVREAELAPPKSRRQHSYKAADVRAWAAENSVPCPAAGRVPKRVVEAWRKATGQTGAESS